MVKNWELLNACRDMSEPSAALHQPNYVCVGVGYRASRRTCVDYSFEKQQQQCFQDTNT